MFYSGNPKTFKLPASLRLSMSLSSHAYAKRYCLGCQATVNVADVTGISVTFSPDSVCATSIIKSSLADANNLPSWLKEIVRTGQSNLDNTLMQQSSFASHKETKASADPVAKYFPMGSNSIQMQVPGWAFNTCFSSKLG